MVRMKNKKRKENIIFVVIGLTGIILVIVGVIILWGDYTRNRDIWTGNIQLAVFKRIR